MKIEKGQIGKNRSKKLAKLLGFIFISIIIHMILVIIFFRHGFHKRAMSLLSSLQQDLTPEQQKQRIEQIKQKRDTVLASLQALKQNKKDNRPAQLRAPKSNFGWVLFDDPPANKYVDPSIPIEIPTTIEGPVGQALASQATENEEGKPTQQDHQFIPSESKQKVEEAPTNVPEHAPIKPEEPPVPKTAIVVAESSPVAEELPGETALAPIKQVQASSLTNLNRLPNQDVTKPITDTKVSHEKIPDLTIENAPVTAGSNPQQPPPINVRGAKSITEKPKRNIIALTKGFVEKTYGPEGTDLVDRDGDPDKSPSFEELKYLSYEAKLNWCLQASWKQNFCYQQMREPSEGDVSIQITIDEHGNVTNCTLVQSSGHAELDTLVLRNVKVASPLPPIPKHFGTKTYTTGRVIRVRSNNYKF